MKIFEGQLTVNINDMLRGMGAAEKLEMIQFLACDAEVMDEIASQMIDGWTSEGWGVLLIGHRGPISTMASAHARRGLEAARRKIAANSGPIAEREIAALEDALRESQRSVAYWVAEYQRISRR